MSFKATTLLGALALVAALGPGVGMVKAETHVHSSSCNHSTSEALRQDLDTRYQENLSRLDALNLQALAETDPTRQQQLFAEQERLRNLVSGYESQIRSLGGDRQNDQLTAQYGACQGRCNRPGHNHAAAPGTSTAATTPTPAPMTTVAAAAPAPASSSTGPAAASSTGGGIFDGIRNMFSGGSSGPANPAAEAAGPSSGGGGIMDTINQAIQAQGGWGVVAAQTAGGLAGYYIGKRWGMIGGIVGSLAGSWVGGKLGKIAMDWWNSRNGGSRAGSGAPPPQVAPRGDPIQRWGGQVKLYPGEEQLFRPGGVLPAQATAQAMGISQTSGHSSTPAYGASALSQTSTAPRQTGAIPAPPHAAPRDVAEARANMQFWQTQYTMSQRPGSDQTLVPVMYEKYLLAKAEYDRQLRRPPGQ